MSGHAAYIAGAFGMAALAIVAELFLLARRRRQPHVDPDGPDNLDDRDDRDNRDIRDVRP